MRIIELLILSVDTYKITETTVLAMDSIIIIVKQRLKCTFHYIGTRGIDVAAL